MAKNKKPIRPSSGNIFLQNVGRILKAIGTPPFFALEIILYTLLWTGDHFFQLVRNGYFVLLGLLSTFVWLAKTIYESFVILINSLKKIIIISNARLPFLLSSVNKLMSRLSFPKIKSPPLLVIKNNLIPKKLSGHQPMFYFVIGLATFFLLIFTPYWIKNHLDQLPDPHLLGVRDVPVSTKIYDRNGILLYSFHANQNRTIVSLNDLPSYIPAAHIAIEDRNFYHHLGFDLVGIIRASLANLFDNHNNNSFQGGSTITQQLIKSALLSPKRTFDRKIKELILAFWAERIYSKKEILTMYLNQVPYGGAAYGIESAAETYFGKHAKDLSLAEAALLAGLPSAPSVYSPLGAYPELAKQRQQQVLAAMTNQGIITPLQKKAAESEELKFAGLETGIKAPHFVMFVKDYLIAKYGLSQVEQGGLEVTTSLDYPTNETVAKMVKDGVAAQKNLRVGNGAALVTNPKTGEILAMVGSVDYFDKSIDGNVNVTTSVRSPGSSIKPVNYALALEKGIISPGTILDDSPIVYRLAGQPDYAPQNYDNKFHGKVTARVSLASSYNIPAVKVLEKNGLVNFLDFAKKIGLTTFTDSSRYGLSVTLGGGEVKMTDMTTAYSAFANDGVKVDLKPVLKVTDFRGNTLEDNTHSFTPRSFSEVGRVLSPQTAFLISNILADDSARSPTFGAGSILNIPGHAVAVKTGTAETKRDNWTIGYTPSLLTAVWVGNNDNSPMSPFLESGNSGAAAIWNPIMAYLLKDKPDETFQTPDNIIAVQICTINGLLTCENCPSTRTEYFTKGTEPKQACKITKEDVERMQKEQEERDKKKE